MSLVRSPLLILSYLHTTQVIHGPWLKFISRELRQILFFFFSFLLYMCKDFDDYNKNHGDFCLHWQMSWTLLALFDQILNYEFMTCMRQLTEYIQSVCWLPLFFFFFIKLFYIFLFFFFERTLLYFLFRINMSKKLLQSLFGFIQEFIVTEKE